MVSEVTISPYLGFVAYSIFHLFSKRRLTNYLHKSTPHIFWQEGHQVRKEFFCYERSHPHQSKSQCHQYSRNQCYQGHRQIWKTKCLIFNFLRLPCAHLICCYHFLPYNDAFYGLNRHRWHVKFSSSLLSKKF